MYKITKKTIKRVYDEVLSGMSENIGILSYEHTIEGGFTSWVFDDGNEAVGMEFLNMFFGKAYAIALENAKTEGEAKAQAKELAKSKGYSITRTSVVKSKSKSKSKTEVKAQRDAKAQAKVQRDVYTKAIGKALSDGSKAMAEARERAEALEATTDINVEAYASTLKEVMRVLNVIHCHHSARNGFSNITFAEGEQSFSVKALNAMFESLYNSEIEENENDDSFIAFL